MATREPQDVIGMSESSDSDRELMSSVISHEDSQVSVCSQQSILSPSISQSLESFTFKTPGSTHAPIRQNIRHWRKKRTFHGNQFAKKVGQKFVKVEVVKKVDSVEEQVDSLSEQGDSLEEQVEKIPYRDTVAGRKLEFQEKRRPNMKKVKVLSEDDKEIFEQVYPVKGNYVVDLNVLVSILAEVAVCTECGWGQLELFDKGIKASCASFLMFRCNECLAARSFWSVSGSFKNTYLPVGDANIQKRNDMVYASILGGRIMGVSADSLKFYHAALNIPFPPYTTLFNSAQKDVIVAAEFVARQSMDRAKLELETILDVDPLTQCVHAIASYDGAYQMRSGKSGGGFSRYCFASAISVDTAKVLAYEVACNSCPECTRFENKLRDGLITEEEHQHWKQTHDAVCPAKYSELASVQLESALAPVIVRQAFARGIVFSGLVCDGDNKTHHTLKNAKIYQELGFDLEIGRLECLSHVGKRLTTNLSKSQQDVLKSSKSDKHAEVRYLTKEKLMSEKEAKKIVAPKYVGTLITDSTTRESWNPNVKSKEIKHLSVSMCAQIASYYRLAVQRNKGDVQAIIKGVNAIPLHLSANDTNAKINHQNCPYAEDSWCQYQAAKFKKRPIPHHPNFLSQTAADLIFANFDHFKYNKPEFIEKICGGMTSNHNESIHKILFQMVRKTQPASMYMMRLGAALAVIRYNDGFAGVRKVFETLGVSVGVHLSEAIRQLDNYRIVSSGFSISRQKKKFAKKQRRGKKVKKQLEKHGEGYSSGKFTTAQPLVDSENEDVAPVPTTSGAKSLPAAASERKDSLSETNVVEDRCHICGHTEEEGIVGAGLGIILPPGDIGWVQCEDCSEWYHLLCLGIDEEDLPDDEWKCDAC